MELFVEHLTVIDCSYLHSDYGLEGQSWVVDLTLHGILDDQGMVMDFGPMKKRLKATIDELVDHKCLVPIQSEHLTYTKQNHGTHHIVFHFGKDMSMELQSPMIALCEINVPEIASHHVVSLLETKLMKVVPETVKHVEIQLREEAIEGADYHYSHGLRKHNGACQRIAHGHRSRIVILRNGERDTLLEEAWASRWKHHYLVSEDDIVSKSELNGVAMILSAYTSPEGQFELLYPSEKTEILPTESTVEHIACYIANTLAQETGDNITVRAYEGVQKGAIAHAKP